MKKVIISLLVAVFLFGCKNPNNPVGPVVTGKLPGKFSVTVLSDAMGGSSRSVSLSTTTGKLQDNPSATVLSDATEGSSRSVSLSITARELQDNLLNTVSSDAMGGISRSVSLGTYTVANSKSIYFILRNVGDFPITDITLTPGKLNKDGGAFEPITDNAVTASPGAITVLETSGKATVETVIEVDINHGNVVGLISQQYVQKADFKGATVRIDGKTTDEDGRNIAISIDLDIETSIKVASFEIQYSEDGGVTYKKAEWGFRKRSSGGYYTDTKVFLIPQNGMASVRIVNTGSVPLKYKLTDGTNTGWEGLTEWETLEQYANLPNGGFQSFFIVDTMGIAFDNEGRDLGFRINSSIVISSYRLEENVICFGVDTY